MRFFNMSTILVQFIRELVESISVVTIASSVNEYNTLTNYNEHITIAKIIIIIIHDDCRNLRPETIAQSVLKKSTEYQS